DARMDHLVRDLHALHRARGPGPGREPDAPLEVRMSELVTNPAAVGAAGAEAPAATGRPTGPAARARRVLASRRTARILGLLLLPAVWLLVAATVDRIPGPVPVVKA